MQIITNNIPRHIIYWHDLTKAEQADFDYLDVPEDACFFRYKGQAYDLGEFMRVNAENEDLKGWQGYSSDSYFSGLLVKYADDNESVIVARYIS